MGGRDKNIIHIASMPKTLVFTAFSSVCTTYRARLWNKTRCHKHPCVLRPCPKHWYLRPKHWYLQHFCHFVQHIAQGCGIRKAFTSVLAFGDHAQNTGIYSVFVSLRAADLTFKGLHSGLTHSISETERQRNSKNLEESDVDFLYILKTDY